MFLISASLLLASLAAASADQMPADFLKVESQESSKWLDEKIQTKWTRVPLRNVLAGEFGAAKLSVDNGKTLDTPITFDADNHSRRETLWRLSRRYGFTVQWTQKQEPRVFLGVPESEESKELMAGMLLTTMSPVQQVDYPKYLEQKQTGFVTREELIDGSLYFGVHTSRCLDVGEASAMVPLVERFKTALPPPEAILDARFTARVRWIKKIDQAEAAAIPIGTGPAASVGIEILSVERPAPRFDKKGDAVLAVHWLPHVFAEDSLPALRLVLPQVFGEGRETIDDKVYDFTVEGLMENGRPGYYCAKATPKVEAKAPTDIKKGSDEELISRWKIQAVTIADIEAGKTKFDKPTGKAWEEFKASVRPGDEVWYFCSPGETWQHSAGWRGYAVVRDGRVVDHITTAMN